MPLQGSLLSVVNFNYLEVKVEAIKHSVPHRKIRKTKVTEEIS